MDIKISVTSEEEKPLADHSVKFNYAHQALVYVEETKGIASVPISNNQSVYVMSEQAYKYMLSKCTSDEAWDLGILGQSEEHAKSVGMPEKLKSLLNKFRK